MSRGKINQKGKSQLHSDVGVESVKERAWNGVESGFGLRGLRGGSGGFFFFGSHATVVAPVVFGRGVVALFPGFPLGIAQIVANTSVFVEDGGRATKKPTEYFSHAVKTSVNDFKK